MKQLSRNCGMLWLILITLLGLATATVAQTTGAQQANQELPDETLRVTAREVTAVQVALYQRGYLAAKPTGVLDRDTREALRAYQQDNSLTINGRIDRATYEHLELTYPATGKEMESLRRAGLLPQIGYRVKDTTVATGKAVSSAPGKVKAGAQAGIDKTRVAGNSVLEKSKETAGNLGGTARSGLSGLGRATQRTAGALVRRNDADIHQEVRAVLAQDEQTRDWFAEVKQGRVTIKTPAQPKADIGKVVAEIRQVVGVKSVFVIAQ